MKKFALTLMIAGATSLMATPAAFNKCKGCHGAAGEKKALGKSKVIKDMSKDEVIAALHGYKDGSYGGPMKGLMKGQVASLTEDDIKAIAESVCK
jgi:cytochrome c553